MTTTATVDLTAITTDETGTLAGHQIEGIHAILADLLTGAGDNPATISIYDPATHRVPLDVKHPQLVIRSVGITDSDRPGEYIATAEAVCYWATLYAWEPSKIEADARATHQWIGDPPTPALPIDSVVRNGMHLAGAVSRHSRGAELPHGISAHVLTITARIVPDVPRLTEVGSLLQAVPSLLDLAVIDQRMRPRRLAIADRRDQGTERDGDVLTRTVVATLTGDALDAPGALVRMTGTRFLPSLGMVTISTDNTRSMFIRSTWREV